MTQDTESNRLTELEREVGDLRRRVQHLQNIIRYAGDIIVTTDLDGNILEFNEGAEDLLGYPRDEIIGANASRLYIGKKRREQLLERLERQGIVRNAEIAVRTKEGRKRYLSLTLTPLRDPDGEVIGTIGVSKDITRLKRLQDKLRRRSITDSLTGLFNQGHFYHLLEIEKERSLRLGHPLSLVLIDLDKFKEYNDTHGHQAGDAALRAIASIIFRSIRKEVDSGFRYGGDEFTVLLPGADADSAEQFAERLRAGIEELDIGEIRASMGVSQFDAEDRRRQIVEEADQAMYASKEAGGNQVTVWRPEG